MIPVRLMMKGFLSYKDEVDIDLSGLEIACISGANGAGKSSLLDAITWALFGRARRSDDALINDASQACEVRLDFDYENARYRVIRSKPRDKGAMLEFQVRDGLDNWRTLTESGIRATEERIVETLRLDYDTFVNASFFLQGKADMFTQQTSGRRKEILSSILGLEVWESYREEAASRRRDAEKDAAGLRAWLAEVVTELDEEQDRTSRLEMLQASMLKTSLLREEKEKSFAMAQALAQQHQAEMEKLELLAGNIQSLTGQITHDQDQLALRESELEGHLETLSRSESIEAGYRDWMAKREELERWNALAGEYHILQSRKADLAAQVSAEGARLQQEVTNLASQQAEMEALKKSIPELARQQASASDELKQLEEADVELKNLEAQRTDDLAAYARLESENGHLRDQMNDLKGRLQALQAAEGPACPLCGQPLDEHHRSHIQGQLETEGKGLGDAFRENSSQMKALKDQIVETEKAIAGLQSRRSRLPALQHQVGQLGQRLADAEQRLADWEAQGAALLQERQAQLENDAYAPEARAQLQQLEAEISQVGYQLDAHEGARLAEQNLRNFEEAYRGLEKSRTAEQGLRREIAGLQERMEKTRADLASQQSAHDGIRKSLGEQATALPDLAELEDSLAALRKEENLLRQQVGAAQQAVDVLQKQRQRRDELAARIEGLGQHITRLKSLEAAFGRDGIPALLIEQALPEIESQANDLLDRLSGGRMSVTFETERQYKDKKREDKKQTLDILISDMAGQRAYELFSGGEAFRINFAIRLALSRVLAQRAGARLQTLVLDEGFGSQDAEGRQRLIEAINLVRPDFALILVITHLDELKDTFPARIEVEKTPGGSRVEVVAA